jgi:hypothetical protein
VGESRTVQKAQAGGLEVSPRSASCEIGGSAFDHGLYALVRLQKEMLEEDEELFNSGDDEDEGDVDSLADDFDEALDLQDVLEADLKEGQAEAESEADANSEEEVAQAREPTRTEDETGIVQVEETLPVVTSTAATSNTGASDDDDDDDEANESAQKTGGKTFAVPQMSKKDKRRAKERRKKEEQKTATKSGTGAVSHRQPDCT